MMGFKNSRRELQVSYRLMTEIIDSKLEGESREETIKRLGITREIYNAAIKKYLKAVKNYH